ncbi:PREDICTED: uncharacterized protein LOC108369839 [Rhagoletis zephyria]|uniref:uncharacterized protein LOC108369839 n=1 Tax=Rhagoletis zephyria TaxID=28612 RepID=UPI00081133F3|nr:PREDICTED: uncharacterized protein LOC108369839 [Rhagoletis zephyria]
MFFKDLIPYAKLDTFKEELLKQRNFVNVGVFTWIVGMLLMCIIFMSLMIVKVASTAEYYQNQSAALRTRNIQSYMPTSADTTLPTVVQIDGQEVQLRTELPTTHAVQPRTRPLRTPNHIKIDGLEEMRAQAHMQQQQQLQQYHQQQQQHEPEEKLHASERAETAYLLERADVGGVGGETAGSSSSVYEQPIYGTWRTKARRPQPPPFVGAGGIGVGPFSMAEGKSSAIDNGDYQPAASIAETRQRQSLHLYEQLPRRSSTMTPVRSELRDQIPRPPRLTSRQPSMMLHRRQYMDIPLNSTYKNEEKPKPFHFPHEGPLPQEFKNTQGADEERGDVHNIQDILHQLQLGGGPSKVPPMVMMPTGLHIAGTFKNLKSSGIANFFRGKRNKKQMQFTIPMPMPMNMQMLKPFPAPMMGMMPHAAAYQQRIAMDQIYPFKPRSPNDVNLLALQQQLQGNRSKNKKKNKQKQLNPNANLMLQQFSNQRPFATEPYMASYQPMLDIGEAQKGKMTRVPFKVNLDIYPVIPPAKDFKPAAFTYDEVKLAPSTRRPHLVRNPFLDYYHMPVIPSTAAYGFHNAYDQPAFMPFRFPSSSAQPQLQPHMSQSSNMQLTFPDHVSKSQFQTPFMPLDMSHMSSASSASASGPGAGAGAAAKANQNQILVHLNVFPKQKQQALAVPTSNNPFYNAGQNINRHIIMEERESLSPIEPRHQARNSNSNSNSTNSPEQPVSRSDSSDPEGLVDFEHPIVAAEVTDQPHAAALVSNKLDGAENSTHYERFEGRSRFQRYNESADVDQMASEAQAASLFRFPVEDLIKFQVDDAL